MIAPMADRDRRILIMRTEGATYRTIAAAFGISYERVRQVVQTVVRRQKLKRVRLTSKLSTVDRRDALNRIRDPEAVADWQSWTPQDQAREFDAVMHGADMAMPKGGAK